MSSCQFNIASEATGIGLRCAWERNTSTKHVKCWTLIGDRFSFSTRPLVIGTTQNALTPPAPASGAPLEALAVVQRYPRLPELLKRKGAGVLDWKQDRELVLSAGLRELRLRRLGLFEWRLGVFGVR